MEQVNELTFSKPEEIEEYLQYCSINGSPYMNNLYMIYREIFTDQNISYLKLSAFLDYDMKIRLLIMKTCYLLSESIKTKICTQYDVEADYEFVDINHLIADVYEKSSEKIKSNLYWHLNLEFREILRLSKHYLYTKRSEKKKIEDVKNLYNMVLESTLVLAGNTHNLKEITEHIEHVHECLESLIYCLPVRLAGDFKNEINEYTFNFEKQMEKDTLSVGVFDNKRSIIVK